MSLQRRHKAAIVSNITHASARQKGVCEDVNGLICGVNGVATGPGGALPSCSISGTSA